MAQCPTEIDNTTSVLHQHVLWLENILNTWSTFPLNIAVIGRSGSGKSSFINAIRDVSEEDNGVAEVNVIESLHEPKEYKFPNHPNITITDLPGVGTPTWPQDTYLERIKFHDYDFFLLLSSDKFSELDVWLANSIESNGKTFYFLRTMIDMAISGDRLAHPRKHSEDDVVKKIRESCEQNLAAAVKEKGNTIKVYLISNHYTEKYDYRDLLEEMKAEFPVLQRKTFNLTHANELKELMEVKKQSFKQRIARIAFEAAKDSRFSTKRTRGQTNVSLIQREIDLYQKQFGTDDDSISDVASQLGRQRNVFMKRLSIKRQTMKTEIDWQLKQYVDDENNISKVFLGLTVVGLPLNIYNAYEAIKSMLTIILDSTASTAFYICEHLKTAVIEEKK